MIGSPASPLNQSSLSAHRPLFSESVSFSFLSLGTFQTHPSYFSPLPLGEAESPPILRSDFFFLAPGVASPDITSSTMATTPAGRMLARQLQQMQQDKDIPGISCGLVDNNVFEWEVMLMISDDVKLYGGMYTYFTSVAERITRTVPCNLKIF